MHRGIDLLHQNSETALNEAVRCFDEAIALRRTLPLAGDPRHRYGLAAGWMNRGDALARIGGKEPLAESIRSYEEALGLLRDLPLEQDPLYPRRLAIAWINCGFAWQKVESAKARNEAAGCFREAIAVLDDSTAVAITDRDLLRAGALVNLAGTLLDDPHSSASEARDAARKALHFVSEQERNNSAAAEAGFKARHLVCRSIAEESRDEGSIPPGLISEATDAVDEGLALARHWEKRGERRFRWLAEDLFRFGCRIYQAGQPHFLTEFILENLDPEMMDGVLPLNRDTHEAAVAALWDALKEIQRDGFQSISTPRFGQLMETLRELRVTEARLEQLRLASLSASCHRETTLPQKIG